MEVIKIASEILIPVIFMIVIISAAKKKEDVFSCFSQGAKESIEIIYNIFPSVFSLMLAISMLRTSGLLDFIISFISPVCNYFKIPPQILPQALLRPLSGSGSLAILSDILKNYGADSLIGITACVLSGSTETTFYTLAVYFGGAGIKKIRYALKAALIADFISIAVSIIICCSIFTN